ncbi:MAG: P-type conjugative transfer protein TrbL, partial [Sphingorhabdus sp.]
TATAAKAPVAQPFGEAIGKREGPGKPGGPTSASAQDANMPAWAAKMQGQQSLRQHRQLAIHALRDGDKGGSGANPDIDEKD